MSDIILYDIPTKGRPSCWSLNPWKTRLALNYKGLKYDTQWVIYPDIAPTLKSFGLPPNGGDETPYTSPAVRLPDGTYVMESKKIATALEKICPEPSLHLDSPIVDEVPGLLSKVFGGLGKVLLPRVPTMCLSDGSVPYFEETRAKIWGKPLAEVGKETDVDDAFVNARPALQAVADLLKKDDSGPFVMGKTVSYSDFYIVGFLQFAKCLGVYEKVVEVDSAFDSLYKASAKWLERDD